ncbi:hypothetical protein [Pigmentiphaga sp. CHJ604]|uniref:hypothetical protein n=1 Tax=Pigmentiphaga sp. CHJ604 TaxID=3081984 RepID=UPI0030D2635C
MPKLLQTNFTAGEISPKAYARVDVQRYMNGAESLENCVVNIHGGAERRPGTVMEAPAKHDGMPAYAIPFVYSTTESYALEFGEHYVRFFRSGGGQIYKDGVPYEIATPYTAAMLAEMDYTQGADTMFLFHQGQFTQVLRRLADDSWTLQDAPFTTIPFDEIGSQPAAALTLSSTAPGTGVSVSASASVFLAPDVGRRITYGSGVALITAFVSPSQVTVTIESAFPGLIIPAGWTLEDSPQGTIKPSEKGTVGATIALTFDSNTVPVYGPLVGITSMSWTGGAVDIATDADHDAWVDGNILIQDCVPAGYNGTHRVLWVPNSTSLRYALAVDPGSVSTLGTARWVDSSTTAVDGWRPEDVGKFVRINRGLVKITEFINGNEVRGVIRQELESDVAAPASAWTLESPVWNAQDGYPRTGCFYEQRLAVAGTKKYPQTVWGSRSGLFFDFTLGTNDDDAFSFALPSTGQINPISQLVSSAVLVPLTYGGEYTMAGGVEKPLAPTNVQVKPRTAFGSSQIKPVRVGTEILFVQRAGRKIRALSYDPDTYRYSAPDVTVMSEHITAPAIVSMAYQPEPRSLVWVARSNGAGAVMTIDRDEGVVAWTPISTQGKFLSFCSIPTPTGDEVWAVVERVIDGAARTYVERFVDGQYLDCAITGSSQDPVATWAGLDHLEGMEVGVRGDGGYLGRFTVLAGAVTLPLAVKFVEIGLMFSSRVRTLRPEVLTQAGTIQGDRLGAHKVAVLVMGTQGLVINGQPVEFRDFDAALLDMPPEIRSGWVKASVSGWYDGSLPLEIVQDQPYPCHVLGLVRDFTHNG